MRRYAILLEGATAVQKRSLLALLQEKGEAVYTGGTDALSNEHRMAEIGFDFQESEWVEGTRGYYSQSRPSLSIGEFLEKFNGYRASFKLVTPKNQLLCEGVYYNDYTEERVADNWCDGITDIVAHCSLSEDTIRDLIPSAFAGNYLLPHDPEFDPKRDNVTFQITFEQLQAIVDEADAENLGFNLKAVNADRHNPDRSRLFEAANEPGENQMSAPLPNQV